MCLRNHDLALGQQFDAKKLLPSYLVSSDDSIYESIFVVLAFRYFFVQIAQIKFMLFQRIELGIGTIGLKIVFCTHFSHPFIKDVFPINPVGSSRNRWLMDYFAFILVLYVDVQSFIFFLRFESKERSKWAIFTEYFS